MLKVLRQKQTGLFRKQGVVWGGYEHSGSWQGMAAVKLALHIVARSQRALNDLDLNE